MILRKLHASPTRSYFPELKRNGVAPVGNHNPPAYVNPQPIQISPLASPRTSRSSTPPLDNSCHTDRTDLSSLDRTPELKRKLQKIFYDFDLHNLDDKVDKDLNVSKKHENTSDVIERRRRPYEHLPTRHIKWKPLFTKKPGFKSVGQARHRQPAGHIGVIMHYLTAVLRSLEPRIDDDFVDRLNYYYTSSIMIMFAILVSAKQYVGHPIECWVPAQFTKGMEQYTENYCWVQNTYWVPFGDLIPSRMEDRERRQIGYYQWVPFILAVEALMFYIPVAVWRLLNTESGINVHGILQMACNDHNIEPENRARTVTILSRHIDDALRFQRDFGNKKRSIYLWAFLRLGKYYGAFITLLYGFVKLLYLINVLGQFFLLNRFLETADYPYFGAHVVWDLLNGQEWRESGKFPRVTLCDFEIRVLGNLHRHTVQCVLVINMFTEKIFIFLWLWFLFLSLFTLANLMFWLGTLLIPSMRVNFIIKYLQLCDLPYDPKTDSKLVKKFVTNFLRPDGIFILRMIAAHSGTILSTELTYSLWLRFREARRPPRAFPIERSPSDRSRGSTIKVPTVPEKLSRTEDLGEASGGPWVSKGSQRGFEEFPPGTPMLHGNHSGQKLSAPRKSPKPFFGKRKSRSRESDITKLDPNSTEHV